MSTSGRQVVDVVRYVECDGLIAEGTPDARPCTFAGLVDGWTDVEASLWGWTCEKDFGGCGKSHERDLAELPWT